jgi:hypothetical protein
VKRKHFTSGRRLIVTNVGRKAQPKRAIYLWTANSLKGKSLYWAPAGMELEFAVHYWQRLQLSWAFLGRDQNEFFYNERHQAWFYRPRQHGQPNCGAIAGRGFSSFRLCPEPGEERCV